MNKRKKSTRHHGSHTHGRGFKKKARGSGHRGGIGMAGSGKRADHKKTLVLKEHGNKYFGKTIRVARRISKKLKAINLSQISEKYKDKKEINLSNYKILSQGELTIKAKIKAFSASKKAIEKIKSSGSSIELELEAPKPEPKEEKKEEKKSSQ